VSEAPPPIVSPPLPFITKSQAVRSRFFDARPLVVGEIMKAREKRLLTHGPQGTGKTRVSLEKARAYCIKYPGIRCLLLRSVRKWLTRSALVTWEDKVVVDGELVPDRVQRENRSRYTFKNGSIVDVAGLDDPQSIFSTEYDLAVLIEANEVSQDTVEKLDARLRNNVGPYQQLLMDCNPQSPQHWLYKAMHTAIPDGRSGKTTWLRPIAMRHTDNPALYTHDGKKTAFGEVFLSRIDDLTGVRRLRLRDGLWVQSDGVVYDQWDEKRNVVKRFTPPVGWRRIWVIDFGYTNPFVWQLWVVDPDGRMFLYREIYLTGRIVEDHAKMILDNTADEPPPEAIICDHDAEDRKTLERHLGNRPTIAAIKAVSVGIDAVQSRMKPAGDGKPRFYIMENTLVHDPDESLVEAKKPTSTRAEIDLYIWKKNTDGTVAKDVPVKEHDHGCDGFRYVTAYLDHGPQRPTAESYPITEPDPELEKMFGGTGAPSWV